LTALLYYSKPVQNFACELNACISLLSWDWAKQRENKKNRTLPNEWCSCVYSFWFLSMSIRVRSI